MAGVFTSGDRRGRRRVISPVGMRATESAVRSDPDERMPQRGAYGVGLDTCCMVTKLLKLLREGINAASDDDGWADLGGGS